MKIPGVFITCDTFAEATLSAARDNAMPSVRHRIVAASEFLKKRTSTEMIAPVVESIFYDLIDALTAPLTEEELATGQAQNTGEETTTIVSSPSWETAFEEFNRVYLENQWGDGLPMVPPTRERVDWMLSGTTRSPKEVIGKMVPKQGMVTIEKIAVNAVMAGARPEYLPVIIAIMEALTDESFDARHVLTAPGSFNLLIVVSGPLVKEIKMESGIGFMGQGWRANNTIGRAVRLTTQNLGHIWPGLNDMALTGRIYPHTFITIAENTALSRWMPYHTDRGYTAEDSCVTVASINSAGPGQYYYGGMVGTWSADGILNSIAGDISARDRLVLPEWGNKGVGPIPGSGLGSRNHLVILFPELVAAFSKQEMDQYKVQREIFERSRVPYEELRPQDIKGLEMALENGVIPEDKKPFFKDALQPGGKVPVLMSPDNVHLFVSGGAPGCAFSFDYWRIPPFNRTALLTKKITGGALTKAGSE